MTITREDFRQSWRGFASDRPAGDTRPGSAPRLPVIHRMPPPPMAGPRPLLRPVR